MHCHFDNHLNLKKLILEKRPKVIVECGAGNGELTRQLANLLEIYQFSLYVVSDYEVPNLDKRINWINGLSYIALKAFPPEYIDLCIIDTDHNYWTLMKELEALFNRVSVGGLIAMHDVETFYHDSGMALKYSNGESYPEGEIQKYAPYGGLGDALIEFLHIKKMEYKLHSFNRESHGAAVIERCPISHFSVFVPGNGAVYAK